MDGQRVAHGVAGEVLDGEPRVGERHLEVAAAFGVDLGMQVVDEFHHERLDFLEAADLGEHVLVVGFHDEAVAVLLEAQQAVAGHVVLDLGDDGIRDGEAALAFEALDDFLGAQSRGSRVPEAQVRYLVGVQVLGALDQLGERCNRVAGRFVGGGVNLHHDFHITLNNNGAIRIHRRQI